MVRDGAEFRSYLMSWLDSEVALRGTALSSQLLKSFTYRGERLPLIGQQGIRKPAGFAHPVSIRTAFTRPNQVPPYDDDLTSGGSEVYKYRGADPSHPENVGLRRAGIDNVPLVWFVGISEGVHLPYYPVYVIGDDPQNLEVIISPIPGSAQILGDVTPENELQKRYVASIAKRRLHQPLFRERVLSAYRSTCTICRLGHRELLDAAHIVPDSDSRGLAIVPNGISLCKIHHGAYDADLLGITPDYVVKIRESILQEQDGPMLLHGLQKMHGKKIDLPRSPSSRPDKSLLEIRFEQFSRPA